MIDNTSLLRDLLTQDTIRMCDGDILHQHPPELPEYFDFEKIEGMLLGLAIGDALGAPTEGKLPAKRRQRYGEITDYLPGRRGRRAATDDTQLAFKTLEQLLANDGLVPDELAKCFATERIWGIGGTTKEFIKNYKDRGIPWYQSGIDSLGNGSLMRIAPVVVPYLRKPHRSLYADAAINTMITHNAYANNASCVAFIKMIWDLLRMLSAPQPEWWIDTFCSVAQQLEGSVTYRHRLPQGAEYEGPLWEYTSHVCREALSKGLTVEDACNIWGSGASIFETVPSVLYILANHANNTEEAIVHAVNDTKDNDTVAAIVGAAVGALHGLRSIPERWIKDLKGVIREGGGGQVFRLIFHAKVVFWLEDLNEG